MFVSTSGSRAGSGASSRRTSNPPRLSPQPTHPPGSNAPPSDVRQSNPPPHQQASSMFSASNDNSSLVRKPFICRKSWSPSLRETQAGGIAITFGEQGYVEAVKGNSWLHIVIPRRTQQDLPKYHGLVPASRKYLEIGTVDYGNITIDAYMNLPLNVHIRSDQAAAGGLFASTFKALCVAFHQAGDRISLPANYRNRLSDPNNLTNLAVQAAQASGVLNILNLPDFDMSQLQSALTPIAKSDLSSGIYIQILAYRFPWGAEIRIGSTRIFSKREADHKRSKDNDKGRFYAAWRSMGTHGQYTMSSLLRNIADKDDRLLLEQFMILMFGSYRRYLLASESRRTVSPQDLENLADASEIFRDHADSITAITLTDLANKTFQTTGWVPLTRRPGSGCSVGWNYSSPIFETFQYEPLIWTRTDVPGVKAVFRRTAIRQTAGKRFEFFSAKRPVALTWGDNMPGDDTLIYPSVEIMLNGKPHPFAWPAIIPDTLAPWTDWNLALGVAIKLEWCSKQTGNWMSRYVQISPTRSHPNMKLDKGDQEASFMGYAQAMGIRRKLLRQSCPISQGRWLEGWDLGVAVVKQVYFDHLKQRIELYDVFGSSPGASPIRIPKAQLELKLKNLGATNIYSPPNPTILVAPNLGRACDYCTVTKGYANTTTKCRRSYASDKSCVVCQAAGIPCSWTMPRPQKLVEALSARPLNEKSIQAFEIEDPQILESQ